MTAFSPTHSAGCANNGIIATCGAVSCFSCHDNGGGNDLDFWLSDYSGSGCYTAGSTVIVQAWLRDSNATKSGIQLAVKDSGGNYLPVQSVGTNPNWPAIARNWGAAEVVEHSAPGTFISHTASYAVSFVAPAGGAWVSAGAVGSNGDSRATGDDTKCSVLFLCDVGVLGQDNAPQVTIKDRFESRRPVIYFDISGRCVLPERGGIYIAEDAAGNRKKIFIP